MDDILFCEYCQAEIGLEDPLVEYDGHDFCGECCMEVWMEENGYDEE